MYKLIRATVVVAGLVMALACGQSNPPATYSQQQGSTPGVSARTELTETSRSGPAAQSPDQAQEPTPAVSGQVEPTEAPATGSRSEAQSGVSSFQEVIGGEYPGLLSLPECDASTQLTMAPLADDAYQVIIPLGLLATPQHVLPTSHIYYHLVREPSSPGGYGPPAVADVRAPGNIRILGVNSSESIGGPQGDYMDYDITFAPCRGRMYQLIHVSTLIPELDKLFESGLTGACNEYGDGQSQYRLCRSKGQLDVPVGTILGTTGGKVNSALDLEAYDLEGPSLGYANLARFRPQDDLRLKVVCPFDDFSAAVRDSQLARMGATTSSSEPPNPGAAR